jgi:hypothetical protein
VLRFAIGATPLNEQGHWPPIEFRVSVELEGSEELVFDESMSSRQVNQWRDREVALSRCEGRSVRIVLETNVPGGCRRARKVRLDLLVEAGPYRVPIRTNHYGMRWRDISKQKTDGRRRMAIVGDSFAFGCWADSIESSSPTSSFCCARKRSTSTSTT